MRAESKRALSVALALAATAASPSATIAQARTASTREARFVDSVLARMTLDEKLGQLAQYPGGTPTGPQVPPGGEAEIRAGRVGSFLNVFGAAHTCAMQRVAVEQSPRRIPLLFGHDVIHGFRTIFPVPLGEAASWDPDLAERSARIAAVEATAHGLHWTFAPMVDIARDPRWGRVVEGAGEDPYLGAAMAAARVRGFQGADLAANNTMMATAKHFAAYGAAEGGRDYNVADVSERTMREVYLPPFRAAVAAGAQSVMAAFNEVAGVPMHANRRLLTDVLRGEWKFDGMVVSDWTGIEEMLAHGVAATRGDAGALALRAGVDMDMVSGIYAKDVAPLVRQGRVPAAQVDSAVRHVLLVKYRLGLFDDPYRYCADTTRQRALTLTPEHRAAAREAARRSIVLLKNQGRTLPLSRSLRTLAVVGGLAADSASTIGNWTADGRPQEAVTVLAGIRRAAGPGMAVLYARGAGPRDADTIGFAEAVRAARQADAVVLVLGEDQEMSAEANSRASLDLPGVQEALARAVVAAGKPVAVVLMNGRPLSVSWLDANVPAIVEAWFPGTEGGNALADVLFGDYNPGAKLPITVPRTVGQVPLYYNHKNTGRPPRADVKWNSKYIDVPWTPLYPFGHGLSYTTFRYDSLQLGAQRIRAGDSLSVRVTVTNTGDRAGDEVVQLYIRDEVGSVTRPVMELRDFRRVPLTPGERRTVTFTLRPDDLAMYDRDMRRVVEPGFFTVFVGTSSASTTSARFEVAPR